MYEKELELRMSRSYGPGRYDRDYEERGRDLPPAYVRWTEQRNMQAFLELVAAGQVKPGELTTHRFPIDDAPQAYALLTGKEAEARPFGVLLEYSEAAPATPLRPRLAAARRRAPSRHRRGADRGRRVRARDAASRRSRTPARTSSPSRARAASPPPTSRRGSASSGPRRRWTRSSPTTRSAPS